MSVIDGQATGGGGTDRVRLKIYNKNTQAVVFDNQLGASDTADPTMACDDPVNSIKVLASPTKSAEIATAVTPDIEYADLKVYPNPFSERLHFEFVSPIDDHVLIQIFDITGRMINTVFDNPVKAGIIYNTDFKPASLVTSIYFYRMTLGEKVFVGKVVYRKQKQSMHLYEWPPLIGAAFFQLNLVIDSPVFMATQS